MNIVSVLFKVDYKCFGGGDMNHQIEQSTAWKQVSKCQNYMKQKL